MIKIKKESIKEILLGHKNPVSFLLHIIGIYFIAAGLWLHNVVWIFIGIILPCIGTFYSLSHKTKQKPHWYDRLVRLYLVEIQIPFHIFGYILLIVGLWRNDLLLVLIAVLIKIIGYFVAYIHEEKNLGVLFYFTNPKKYKIVKKSVRKH